MIDAMFPYDAFISYTTETDYALARDLEGFLGRFHELQTPESITLKQLQIWRDETGRSISSAGFRKNITHMLEEYLAQCRYLIMLWSIRSLQSEWMRLEFNWFRTNRGLDSVLLGVTDAPDPAKMRDTLFWSEIIECGLINKPWYDFRGFRKDSLPELVRLRDYEEARVQLAADLNGYSPGEIQPIWWRNKVREQQERAEREERARRQIELAECDARLEAAHGWYERAFVYFRERRYRHASHCLINALTVSPPERVPEHYPISRVNPGWSEDSWSFLQCSLALAPRLIRRYEAAEINLPSTSMGLDNRLPPALFGWIDDGRAFAVAKKEPLVRTNDWLKSLTSTPQPFVDRLEVFDSETGNLRATLVPPAEAGKISAWAASRKTQHVAFGTEQGWLCVWSGETGKIISHQAHQIVITAVALSSDGQKAATGSGTGEILIWSDLQNEPPSFHPLVAAPLETQQDEYSLHILDEMAPEGQQNAVGYLRFVQGGSHAIFVRNGTLQITAIDATQTDTLFDFNLVETIAFDETRQSLAYNDGDIICMENIFGDDKFESLLYAGQHLSYIKQISFSAKDRHLLSRDLEGVMCLWSGQGEILKRNSSMQDMQIVQTFGRSNRGVLFKHLEGLEPVEFFDPHPVDANRLMVYRNRHIEEWNLGFLDQPASAWSRSAEGVRRAAWHPDGKRVVAGSDDGVLQMFEVGIAEPVQVFAESGAAIGCVAISGDGAMLAAASQDKYLSLWSVESGELLSEAELPNVPFSVNFIDSRLMLAVGLADGSIYLCDLERGDPHRLGSVEEAVTGLVSTPDGNMLIAGSPKGITVWELDNELEIWSSQDLPFEHFHGISSALTVSNDGQLVCCGCYDGTVRCYETATGKLVSVTSALPSVVKPQHVTAVGFGSDNRSVFAGLWDGSLCYIDVLRGRELFRFQAHSKVVTTALQAPNSGYILSSSLAPTYGGDNKLVCVWELLDTTFMSRPGKTTVSAFTAAVEKFFQQYGEANLASRKNERLEIGFADRPQDKKSKAVEATSPLSSKLQELKQALRAEPEIPERHLAVGMAYLAENKPLKAVDYFERLIRMEHESLITDKEAQSVLGEFYVREEDFEEGIHWFTLAGENGHSYALLQLGILAVNGKGMPADPEKGINYFRQSAALGNVNALYNMGIAYEHILGKPLSGIDWRYVAFGELPVDKIPDSLKLAFDWYQKAADAGHAAAQVRMGDFYAVGSLVARDVHKARDWYQLAAQQENKDAKAKLASLPRL